MNEIDIAWAAGFYEGEGCAYGNIKKSSSGRPQPCLQVTLNQVYKEPIEKFMSIFPGGNLYFYKRTGNSKDIWQLTYNGAKGEFVIETLFPYLSERRKEQYRVQQAKLEEARALRESIPKKDRASKTHCKRNHEFTEENTYTPPGSNKRVCKICRTMADEKRRNNGKSRVTNQD